MVPDGQSIAFTALVPSRRAPPTWAPPAILPRLRPDARGLRPRSSWSRRPAEPRRQISSGDFDYPGEPAWMPDGRSILASRDDGQIYAYFAWPTARRNN